MDSQNKPNAASLNEYQARRLRVTSQYIDKILGGIEEILNFAASKAAFPRYVEDVAPAQRRTIENYIARIRAQLVRVLDGQGISRDKPFTPASRAIHVALGTIDIAVEELKLQYMRGYRDLPEAAATELNGIVGELYGLVSKLDRYLAEGVGQDLKLRLQRLEKKNNDLELLSRIEDVVARRGVVEVRTAVASILDRAEDKTFEIALFGRVSSGKSSNVLRGWTRRVTNQLLRRFETYAEGHRAQAERSLGGKNIPPEEAHGVREDIELLAVRAPEHIEPNSQAQKDCEGVFPFSGEVVRHAQGGESD
jgi:hypothetical protein